jgi:transcriptional regulator with XRE-family HTH domain
MDVNLFFDPNWGKVLRKIRNKKGLSEREVGEKLGCSHVAVDKWENGKTPISQPILYKLLYIYEYSWDDFISLLKEITNQ